MTAITRRDHLLGASLCIGYVLALLATAPAIGLSRDESMYVTAAESYAAWLELLAQSPKQALERESIDRYWRVNSEHPSLPKTTFALSYLLDKKLELFDRPSLPFRLPGMLSAGLLLWLINVMGARTYGRRAGLFAALAYALLPRPFYHAHLNAFDVPITLAITLVVHAYERSLRERRWALACGALFGLALATKHNSWVLPGVIAIHFACVVLRDRFATVPPLGRLSRVPYALIAMLMLGPAIFIASWPFLYDDTFPRIGRYAAFHLRHEYYNIAYFGVNYFWPPFPKSYPFVMTWFTVPLTTLLCAFTGLFERGRVTWLALRDSQKHDPGTDHLTDVLWLGCLLSPLVMIVALPSAPIFGGTKHWFTAYPFMALFAGAGFDLLVRRVGELFSPSRVKLHVKMLAPVLSGALMLSPALVETVHSHPFGLSHYGFGAGFVVGAAEKGMNRQFWGFTTGSVVPFLNARLPNGGRVYVCDMTFGAFRMLARDGLLNPKILPTADIAGSDLALIHHEHHFAEVEHQIWSLWGTTRPAHVLAYDGVPIVTVYENPRRKR